jgi:ribosomal protein S18 acetylase RimI-like enzyme
MDMTETIKIRTLTADDLEHVVNIDRAVLHKERLGYWQTKLELSEARSPMASLVGEMDGKVVGFIIGDASGWEYGAPDTIGFIDTIEVLPEYQRRGVAKLLFHEMVANLKKVGVETIYTFVDWRNWDLVHFFNRMGFEKGDMLHLQLKV